jgi:hypothetical protein
MARITETHARTTRVDDSPALFPRWNAWLGWIPLLVLPAIVCVFRSRLAPWQFMWILSIAIFLGCKWETWFRARADGVRAGAGRSLAYLFLWPGMDAAEFLEAARPITPPSTREWLNATAKTLFGAALIWIVTRKIPAEHPLLAGWVGMLGLVLILHFGTFHFIALVWQAAGVNARPIMQAPASATSLSEFWGKRWNLGFRQLTHGLVFEPIRKRAGIAMALLAAFVASGIIHDIVISFPARGGYGLPTGYFLLQGISVLFERSPLGRRLGVQSGFLGWLFVLLCAGLPAFWLFHPLFIRNVMLPFFAFIGAL